MRIHKDETLRHRAFSHPKYRPEIDGLRAIAVLSVVGFHSFPNWVRGGFIGVDVFFVISGYLISTIIFENLEAGTFSFAEFYARRVRRIFPALLVVLTACFAFGWFILLPDEYKQLGKHVAAGAGFVANLVLWQESGYFDNASDTKPLLHLWSLGIEEQYYIVWPLLVWAAWKRKLGLLVTTVGILIGSFILNIRTIQYDPLAAFYSPLTRFWELLSGSLLAWFALHKKAFLDDLSASQCNVLALVGAALLVSGLLLITKDSAFPGWWALLPVMGAILLISAGSRAWLNQMILGNGVAVWFGLISYPLYLWHWPLLIYPKIASGELTTPAQRVFLIALAIVMAWITYKFIELQSRRAQMPVAYGLAGAMAFAAMLGLSAMSIMQPRHTEAGLSKILSAKLDWQYPGGSFKRVSNQQLRVFATDGGSSTTLFIGDSDMEQYAARVNYLARRSPSTLNTAVFIGNQDGCQLLAEVISNGDSCNGKVQALKEIASVPKVSAVVFAASWYSYEKLLEADAGFTNFLNRELHGKRVFIVLNMPSGSSVNPQTMFKGSRLGNLEAIGIHERHFDFADYSKRYLRVNARLTAIARAAGAGVIDPTDYLCPRKVCPIFDNDGRPLYRDSDHMTSSYSASSATYIDQTLGPFKQIAGADSGSIR